MGPTGCLKFIISQVVDGMGECFVGSRYFAALLKHAFSLLFTMTSLFWGPSIFTPISKKFLLGPLGVPRAPQDDF